MTDEQQVRALLTLAADMPDDVQPPVRRLLDQGRRRRTRRAGISALTVAALAVAAVALPPVIRALGTGRSSQVQGRSAHQVFPVGSRQSESGPTAAEIARFGWSALPSSPLHARSQPTLVWAGQELLELGGIQKGSTTNDGAAFNPATGRWHKIAPVVGLVGLTNSVTVWTGRDVFVTNGEAASCLGNEPVNNCLPHAGLYDPATNRWSATLLPAGLEGLAPVAAVWTGRDVILAAVGQLGTAGKLGVAAYDPATNHWTMMTPSLPAGHPTRYVSMAATSDRLILWSLWDQVPATGDGAGVDVLTLGPDGTWRDDTGNWPQNQNVTSPVYAGSAILVSPGQIWCGSCSHPYSPSPGYFADPSTLHMVAIPLGPLGQADPSFIWTGRTIIAVDLDVSGGRPLLRDDDMALWNPSTNNWTALPPPPGYPTLSTAPVWAGTQLLELTTNGNLLSFHR